MGFDPNGPDSSRGATEGRRKDPLRDTARFAIEGPTGLAYDNFVLLNFVAGNVERFREVTRDSNRVDVLGSELRYARARDWGGKSLGIIKSLSNALHGAIARAIENVYLLEADPEQPLFGVLGLKVFEGFFGLAEVDAGLAIDRQAARWLELQGEGEHAPLIRSDNFHERRVPSGGVTGNALRNLETATVAGEKRAKLLLLDAAKLALKRGCSTPERVPASDLRCNFTPTRSARTRCARTRALEPERSNQKHFFPCLVRNPDPMLRLVEPAGVDARNVFNKAPLMVATRLGNLEHADRSLQRGADTALIDSARPGLPRSELRHRQARGVGPWRHPSWW